jgi:NAD-dependent dihydropyrimidine dehydrogenase PreA subunit
MFAAIGGVFLICRYDPFVTFFRFNGNWNLWVLGISFLLISLFIGRPYCRFLCPYGVILRQLGRLSKWRVTITPDECIQCRLCEQACPFNAVVKPVKELPATEIVQSKRRVILLIALLPILMAVGGWIGATVSSTMVNAHLGIHLAEHADAGSASHHLNLQAETVLRQFFYGGMAIGVFMGFVAGSKLIAASVIRRQRDYQAHRAGCFACGRCFAYCPIEIKRRLDKDG